MFDVIIGYVRASIKPGGGKKSGLLSLLNHHVKLHVTGVLPELKDAGIMELKTEKSRE